MGVGASLQSTAIDIEMLWLGASSENPGMHFQPEFSCFQEATKSDCICGFLLLTAHLYVQLISGCWRSYSKISFFDDLTRLIGKIVPFP